MWGHYDPCVLRESGYLAEDRPTVITAVVYVCATIFLMFYASQVILPKTDLLLLRLLYMWHQYDPNVSLFILT